ncbi:MAG: hypothetical protein C4526_12155 [Nitrospiraceae bacterium]|nr:MAG: hypothetical protein C4526_12155 [Nitrospiraceae bacterium]
MRNKSQKSEVRSQKSKELVTFFLLLLTVHCSLFTDYAYSQGLIVMANKISGELPLDPDNSAWNRASGIEIPLAPQVMAKPRVYESGIKKLNVRALHNTKEAAFLLTWEDNTEDAAVDVDRFSDAVALEFPSSSSEGKPHFAMGDTEKTVNIWFWKAAWQSRSDGDKVYATSDDFLGGVLAGNPVSEERTLPVENLVAQGFGSATDMEKADIQNITGSGKWKSGKWAVVFKRPLTSDGRFNVKFKEGSVTPLAFAVWNGSEGDRGGRKVVSTWYYVGFETEEKKTIYFYPVLAFIGALGIEAGIIMGIRRKRV